MQVHIVDWVSAFVMVSTFWSVSRLLCLYTHRAPAVPSHLQKWGHAYFPCPAICKSGGTRTSRAQPFAKVGAAICKSGGTRTSRAQPFAKVGARVLPMPSEVGALNLTLTLTYYFSMLFCCWRVSRSQLMGVRAMPKSHFCHSTVYTNM